MSLVAAALVAAAAPSLAEPLVDAGRYDRAARFFPDNRGNLVLNATFAPHWRGGGSDRFTYRRELGDGRSQFVVVEAETGRRKEAFRHAVVAAGLGAATGTPVDPARLPFKDYDEVSPRAVRFTALGKTWTCSTVKKGCRAVEPATADPLAVPSPDGKWLAFVANGNLWVRSADGQVRFALTTDAVPHYSYAAGVESTPGVSMTGAKARALAVKDGHPLPGPPGPPAAPQVLWSPDSQRLFTHRIDEREVREITLVQSTPMDGSTRPIASSWRYAMPNDVAVARVEPWIFDVVQRTGRPVAVAPIPAVYLTPVDGKDAWWSPDGRTVYLIARTRYYKTMSLEKIDASTGQVRELITETGKTFVESAGLGERPMVYVLANGDILWFSERDGYGHLYLYDGDSGRLRRRLTDGQWTVRNVLHLDEANGQIYVAGNEREPGTDPYYRIVYRIGLADGRVARLTPEDADHAVRCEQEVAAVESPAEAHGFSPSGRFFLDTYTRSDLPPRTVLRRSDGRLVAEIEQANIARLVATGLVMPERFSALAADGRTMLYGVILRPSDFDPGKRYPVIDSPYPGPQAHRANPGFVGNLFDPFSAQSYAELGFIVVLVDGRGTHGRSKAFHDESYGGLAQAGHLDDHVAVIRELARRYPYMDLDRVGIYGISGGAYATVHAMATFPDFFKVGIADAGNHDQRGYLAVWGETYNGPESGGNYAEASNALLASSIQGKLFLLHGDMDSNVFPSHTLQVVDALIKANKDFDLLIVPNAGHGTLQPRSYPLRRAWDFMVRNLMNARPPDHYEFPPAPGPE